MNSLSGADATPPDPIVDGGVLVAKVPNLPLGEPDRGYTNTGIFYCKEETEARTDGKMIFWSANWGRKDNATAGGRFSSVVKLAIDYAATDGYNFPATYTAELIDEILTYDLASTSMQGIILRNDGTIWFSDSGFRGIQPYADAQGKAIQIASSNQGIGPSLAYDEVNDYVITVDQTTGDVESWSFPPSAAIQSVHPTIDLSSIVPIDHCSLNLDEDIFMVTFGGRSLRYYKWSTGELIGGQTWVSPETTIDIEGSCLVKSHYDGTYYIFTSSDNWFHDSGNNLDTDINAVWKSIPTITLPLP